MEEAFLAQTHAEGRIAFASRAMNAPCHLDKARILGCPRLPSPAILLFNRYSCRAEGNELSSSVRTSSGGLAVYGERSFSLFLNCTGSRSLTRPSERSQRWSSARINALPPAARASR